MNISITEKGIYPIKTNCCDVFYRCVNYRIRQVYGWLLFRYTDKTKRLRLRDADIKETMSGEFSLNPLVYSGILTFMNFGLGFTRFFSVLKYCLFGPP